MFHYFDEAGLYTHSAELPLNPVSGLPFDHNPAVCTPDPVPGHNPGTEQARRVNGAWVIEPRPAIPAPEPEPEASLEEMRVRAHVVVNAWRTWKEQQDITFEHAGRVWDGGLTTRQRLKPVLSLAELPAGFFWTDHDNNDVAVTAADLAALDAAHEIALVTEGFRIHVLQRQMKAAIELMDRAQLAEFNPQTWQA